MPNDTGGLLMPDTCANVHVIDCNVPPSSAPDMIGQHWVDRVARCHWLSVGVDSLDDWIKVPIVEYYTIPVGASSSENLHTYPMASLCNAHFQTCIFSEAEDKWKSLQLFGAKKTSTTLEDSISDILGESLDVSLNYSVSGTDALLVASNNETFGVTIKFKVEIV